VCAFSFNMDDSNLWTQVSWFPVLQFPCYFLRFDSFRIEFFMLLHKVG
jgi:hypothetical protein